MDRTAIIVTLIVIVGLGILYNRARIKNSAYYKTKKHLDEALALAVFSNDWRKKQEVKLQLAWLSVIEKVVKDSPFVRLGEKSVDDALIRLNAGQIRFPQPWDLNDRYCYPLATAIVGEVGSLLVAKPSLDYTEEELPYPRPYIEKAIHFLFDYLNHKDSGNRIPDKEKVADALGVVQAAVNTPISNDADGSLSRQRELDDLSLIDWRSATDWIARGVRYADQHAYTFAFACYGHAKNIEPYNRTVDDAIAITHLSKGEWLLERGEKELAVEAIRASASHGNAEAIEWLVVNQPV